MLAHQRNCFADATPGALPRRVSLPASTRRVAARAAPVGRDAAQPHIGRRTVLGGVAPILCCGCPCCGDGSGGPGSKRRLQWYDKYFAQAMHTSMGTYEAAIAPVKEELFDQLLGAGASGAGSGGGGLKLLEVGIGTGPNLSYMVRALGPERLPELAVTGLDPNPEMQPFCRQSAAAAGLAPGQLRLVEGGAEAMPFEDGEFDAAVITLVLCSVPSPSAALAEVKRVVAPGGRLAIIEHVAAPGSKPLLSLGQRVFDPLQQLVADGCHLTRNTGGALRAAGLDTASVRSFEVPGLSILAPHIAGIVQL